jgi:predicted nucleic acid-binding Zn ribbon protein
MTLMPIAAITVQIQSQPGWEGVRDWGTIVRAWMEIVSPIIAARSRPKSIAREILTIATDSSSLAHQLTFGRQALCRQLNDRLVSPVKDLRFVPVGAGDRHSPTATEDLTMPIHAGSIVICTHCDCRARQGELLRWGVCQFCAIDLGIIGGRDRRVVSGESAPKP